jgi:hypothetical protein
VEAHKSIYHRGGDSHAKGGKKHQNEVVKEVSQKKLMTRLSPLWLVSTSVERIRDQNTQR